MSRKWSISNRSSNRLKLNLVLKAYDFSIHDFPSFPFLFSWNFGGKKVVRIKIYDHSKSYARTTWMIHAREYKTRGDGSRARTVSRKLSANIGTRYAIKRDTGRLPWYRALIRGVIRRKHEISDRNSGNKRPILPVFIVAQWGVLPGNCRYTVSR